MIGHPKKQPRRRKSLGAKSRRATEDNRPGVYFRDGRRCVVQGSIVADRWPCSGGLTVQHAIGKGMGGSAQFDSPELLRTMCLNHNVLQTSNAAFARFCLWFGWSLPRHRIDVQADRYPVRYPDGADYFLDNDYQKHLVGDRSAFAIRSEAHPDLAEELS
jgi:hypothetical protein